MVNIHKGKLYFITTSIYSRVSNTCAPNLEFERTFPFQSSILPPPSLPAAFVSLDARGDQATCLSLSSSSRSARLAVHRPLRSRSPA